MPHIVGSGPTYTYSQVTDLTVSGVGLTGIGVETPVAHLDISDQNNDALPLLRATPYGSSTPGLYVDPAGVVSVGDVASFGSYALEVHGSAGVANTLDVSGKIVGGNGTNTGQLDIRAQSLTGASYVSQISLADPTLKAFRVNLNGSPPAETFSILGNGKTVISSTTAPSTDGQLTVMSNGIALDLVNNAAVGFGNQIIFHAANGDGRHLIYDDFGPVGGGSSPTKGNLVIAPGYFFSSGPKVLQVIGKVQIGTVPTSSTSAPSLATDYSLYVEKGVIAEKFKCSLSTTSDWSDYVFDKNYKLAPLSDVETYIKANKHLPGVPSAEDVHCEGIDMAQMDATLLKKIEELTLYVVTIQKENDQIKAEITKLKKQKP